MIKTLTEVPFALGFHGIMDNHCLFHTLCFLLTDTGRNKMMTFD